VAAVEVAAAATTVVAAAAAVVAIANRVGNITGYAQGERSGPRDSLIRSS